MEDTNSTDSPERRERRREIGVVVVREDDSETRKAAVREYPASELRDEVENRE